MGRTEHLRLQRDGVQAKDDPTEISARIHVELSPSCLV